MTDVVIVEAGRSPIGKRNGSLAGAHPADVLGPVVLTRPPVNRGLDPLELIDDAFNAFASNRFEVCGLSHGNATLLSTTDNSRSERMLGAAFKACSEA